MLGFTPLSSASLADDGVKGTSLSLDAGSYSVTGYAASIAITIAVALGSGSYAVAGHDLSVSFSRAVSLDSGSYSLTGYTADFSLGNALNLDAGSYSISGNDVVINTSIAYGIDAGSYSVTGNDLEISLAQQVLLDAGTYSATGHDVSVSSDEAINLDAGSYALTGNDLTLNTAIQYNLDAGSYALTGNDLTVGIAAGNINLASGSYSLFGYPAKIKLSTSRLPESIRNVIGGDVVSAFWLCDLEFDTPNDLHFWNGIGNLTIDGQTYTGAGNLLNLSEMRESSDIAAYGATLTLSGIPSNEIDLALAEPYQGRRAIVKFGVDVAGVKTAFTVFTGEMDQMNISFGPDTATISLNVESRLIDLNRPRIRRYTDADQKTRYSGDLAFEFVTRLQSESLQWKAS